ncbi:MAG: putative hydrolase of the HAD superfamily, partial [Candidatus Azotimanducaceae bacterium]
MKNVVFDAGNVLVRWSPVTIVEATFGDVEHKRTLTKSIFRHPIWTSLNLGEVAEAEAKEAYKTLLSFSDPNVDSLFHQIKETQVVVDGTVNLIERLKAADYAIYALTDNVHEAVAHLRERYDFWQHFIAVVVSAEVSLMKPGAEIFKHLLEEHRLEPLDTVFIDDHAPNVAGAQALGISGIQFSDAKQCEGDL